MEEENNRGAAAPRVGPIARTKAVQAYDSPRLQGDGPIDAPLETQCGAHINHFSGSQEDAPLAHRDRCHRAHRVCVFETARRPPRRSRDHFAANGINASPFGDRSDESSRESAFNLVR